MGGTLQVDVCITVVLCGSCNGGKLTLSDSMSDLV
jgi:hypothetical protein